MLSDHLVSTFGNLTLHSWDTPPFKKNCWLSSTAYTILKVNCKHKFVILTDYKPLLAFIQLKTDSQKLRRWQDFLMTFNYTIEHIAGKDNHIADTLSRMHKYLGISATEDDLIPHSVDSTTGKPLQEITTNHINLSDHSTTSSPTPNHSYHNMPSRGAINFNDVNCDFHKCRGRAETARHHHSCPYPDEEHMELTSKDDYKVIKKED